MRLPILQKMPSQRPKVSSHHFTPPFPYSPFSHWLFWKLADRYKIDNLFYSVAPYQYYELSQLYLALVELLLASQESLSLEHR